MEDTKRAVSVLIVEDDEDIRETVTELLQDEGYSVEHAGNGRDALALLETISPQTILLDLSMPIMSGQEFRAAQLADPRIASIPTVVMSAADRLREKTAPMQVNDLLTKPVKLDQLLQVLARYCQRD